MTPHEVVQSVSSADLIGERRVAAGIIFREIKWHKLCDGGKDPTGAWVGEQERSTKEQKTWLRS